MYLGDRELLDVFPMVPLGKNLTFNVAIVSYNGRMDFGLIGDFDTMPDLDEVAADFAAAFDEVRAEAGVGEQPTATEPAAALDPEKRMHRDRPPIREGAERALSRP